MLETQHFNKCFDAGILAISMEPLSPSAGRKRNFTNTADVSRMTFVTCGSD